MSKSTTYRNQNGMDRNIKLSPFLFIIHEPYIDVSLEKYLWNAFKCKLTDSPQSSETKNVHFLHGKNFLVYRVLQIY